MKPTKCNTCKGKRVKNEYRHGLSDTPPHPIEMSALSLPQPKTSECATCDGNRKSVYCPLCAKFYGKPLPIERPIWSRPARARGLKQRSRKTNKARIGH
jgi:hypothetical protein